MAREHMAHACAPPIQHDESALAFDLLRQAPTDRPVGHDPGMPILVAQQEGMSSTPTEGANDDSAAADTLAMPMAPSRTCSIMSFSSPSCPRGNRRRRIPLPASEVLMRSNASKVGSPGD